MEGKRAILAYDNGALRDRTPQEIALDEARLTQKDRDVPPPPATGDHWYDP